MKAPMREKRLSVNENSPNCAAPSSMASCLAKKPEPSSASERTTRPPLELQAHAAHQVARAIGGLVRVIDALGAPASRAR